MNPVAKRKLSAADSTLMTVLTRQPTHTVSAAMRKLISQHIPRYDTGYNFANVQINSRISAIYNWNCISIRLLHFANLTHRIRF